MVAVGAGLADKPQDSEESSMQTPAGADK